jgi:hypothetical protein
MEEIIDLLNSLVRNDIGNGKFTKREHGTSSLNNILDSWINCQIMQIEDLRSVLLREANTHKLNSDEANKKLKLDQMKLADDIKEFLFIKDHFEKFRVAKLE